MAAATAYLVQVLQQGVHRRALPCDDAVEDLGRVGVLRNACMGPARQAHALLHGQALTILGALPM